MLQLRARFRRICVQRFDDLAVFLLYHAAL
jgi:hypothetical protein